MLGSNVPTVGGLATGFRYADEWGCECIQIYLTLSRRWDVLELTQQEITKFKTAWENSSVKKVVAHVPYLVNLASPNKEIREKSIKRLAIEISRAITFGVPFLILHPGSYIEGDRETGIQRIIEALDIIGEQFSTRCPRILLETMTGQGTMLGYRFKELAQILEGARKKDHLGVCIDTGHLFMAGYDFRGYRGYEEVMAELDRIIGLEKIGAFHLNDSKTKLGSRSDRHSCIGEGELGLQVFHALLRDLRFTNAPMILEIPERDTRSKDNLELLRKLQTTSSPISEKRSGVTQLALEEVR